MKQFTVTLTLDEGQQRKLDEFAALRRKCELVPRPGNCYTHEATLQYILSIASFDAIVEDASAWERELLSNRKETVSEFWEVELPEDDEAEPDEPEEEPETVSNGEEEASARTDEEPETPPQLVKDRTDEYFNYLEHGTMPEDSHETLISVIDADGVHRMATLDEVEEMREAAQGIYNGAPPEPKEPEDSFRDKGYLYDPARYEGDAYECGSIVVSDPESLAFADALFEALYR